MLSTLENLFNLARERKKNPVDESYTNKLLIDKSLSKEKVLEEIGELIIPIEKGVITKDDIRADLFELCSGASGRKESSDITVFKNGGGGHLDLMTATYIEKCFRSIT